MGDVEDLVELNFELVRVGAEFADADHVKGALEELGDSFCCESFACAGRSVEDGYETATLA